MAVKCVSSMVYAELWVSKKEKKEKEEKKEEKEEEEKIYFSFTWSEC